jgi:hypothetical protein
MERMADSHNNIAASLNLKELMSAVQIEFRMYRELGDDDGTTR